VTRYFDYAATTPTDPRVVEEMLPYYTEHFGNPNSLYTIGRDAYKALENARERIAEPLGAKPEEIIFTSGGTESDNAALVSTLWRLAPEGGAHIITSAYEHHAILEVVEWLGKHGHEISIVKPRKDGHVAADDIEAAMRPNTKVVSVIMANNEIGSINDIATIAQIAHEGGALMHTDAVQALGKIEIDVEALGIDMLSMSAHKIYGPRGIGALYLRRGTRFDPLIKGGGQESRRRSGTQNVVGAVGFAKALEIIVAEMDSEAARLSALRDFLIDEVTSRLENTLATVESDPRLPNIVPLLVKGVEGEAMLLQLDNLGFSVSTGSACSSGSLEASHVLLSIGVPQEIAHGSLRLSMGRWTTKEDCVELVDALIPIVERLREMSPVYKRMFCGEG